MRRKQMSSIVANLGHSVSLLAWESMGDLNQNAVGIRKD